MKKTKLSHTVLAEGEVTGHAHRASGSATLYRVGESLMLDVEGATTVTHEEHGPVALPVGQHDIIKVREYDHWAEEAREVVD